MRKIFFRNTIFAVLILISITACNRNKIKPTLPAEERMKIAEKMFNDGDYLDAKTEFQIILLNFPGSTISDKAQFMYGECYFKLKQYVIATVEYQKLTRIYPNSQYVDDAQYKSALSYFKLSPKYSLDQDNTLKAIEEFQKFLEDYPNSDLVPEANKAMRECRDKLAKKKYKNAESYRKLTLYKSAIIYYDHVLDNYYDTQFAQKSLIGKAECYNKMGDFEQAVKFYTLYLDKYPDGSKASKANVELLKIQGEKKQQ